MSNFGFIKITTGKSEGRIGRLIELDQNSKKGKISFGYETDVIPHSNYKYYSMNSISNNVTKQDLIDRYFAIAHELKSVDVRGHSEIRKYSAEHTSLISECNMIRGLLREYFSLRNLKPAVKEANIIFFCSFFDTIWTNELALDLEMKGFNIGICNHELYRETLEEELSFSLKIADHYIFIVHEGIDDAISQREHSCLQENKEPVYQTISFIVKNKQKEQPEKGIYYFSEPFSSEYEKSLSLLTERLEMPQ